MFIHHAWCNNPFAFRGFFAPTMTNTQVETKPLQGRDFPLIFKICPQPGFRAKDVFKENGYKTAFNYFYGRSMFNKTIYGWAGHKNDSSGPLSTAEMVYSKVSMFSPEDIIQKIDIDLNDGKIKLNHSHVFLLRVNYPLNCFTLNLTGFPKVKEKGVKTMTFSFKLATNLSYVQINPQAELEKRLCFVDQIIHTL